MADIKDYLESFLSYLRVEKTASNITIRDYRMEIIRLSGYLDSQSVSNINLISTRILRQYFYYAKEERNLASSSVSKVIATVKSFFNFLEEDEIIIRNPSRKIKLPKKARKIPEVMSKNEVDLIINSIDFAPLRYRKNAIRDKLIISLLYYTGIRKSELLNLNWSDLNLSRSTMIIRSGKGNKDRLIPLHDNVFKILDKYLEERLPIKTDALIVGTRGKRICQGSFVNLLNLYLEISGLKKRGYSAHSFRHYVECYIMVSEALFA